MSKGSCASLPSNPDAAVQHAFLLQYITLVVIVLAFLVGTFSKSALTATSRDVEGKPPPEAPVLPATFPGVLPAEPEGLKSILEFGRMFEPATLNLNRNEAETLAGFLLNHDLKARIDTNLGFCRGDINEACLLLELRANSILGDFLAARKIPISSMAIHYSPSLAVEEGAPQVRIKLFNEEEM